MNNLLEDFLLLAAGGVVGLAAGVALSSEEEDYEEEDMPVAEDASLDDLLQSITSAASSALASCKTDEEREAVRTSIRQSLETLQANLAERHEATAVEASTDTAAHAMPVAAETRPAPGKSFVNADAQAVQQLIEKLGKTIERTMATRPNTEPQGAPAV